MNSDGKRNQQSAATFVISKTIRPAFCRLKIASPFATISSGRRDIFQIVQGSVAYQVLDWMSLRLFGGYRDRDSNVRLERFNDFTAGAELKLEWPQNDDVSQPKEEERVPRRPT